MVDNSNHEARTFHHGGGGHCKSRCIPTSPKAEVSAPPLDTSSQASVEEMETSQESNPINVYSPMATGSNCSDSPMIDLTELQADANLAANHMLSIKRSFGPQKAMGHLGFWGVTVPTRSQRSRAANERAKIVHSRKDLNAKVRVCQGGHES